jgi:hypothetical protein
MARRFRQNLGLILGLAVGVLLLVVLLLPDQEAWHARGPMTSGHEDVACEHCHRPAPGSLRQQLQANVRHLLGRRATAADFGLQQAGNSECLGCHDFPEERHPVFRFFEPRFQKSRDALHPEFCVSCHLEHRGQRVTLGSIDYCRHCHEETRLKSDPLDVSHVSLIKAEKWDSCLGCHDFHGNHLMTTREQLQEAIPPAQILEYFRGGPSPYSADRKFTARREPLR